MARWVTLAASRPDLTTGWSTPFGGAQAGLSRSVPTGTPFRFRATASDRRGDVGMDVEDLGQTGDPEDLQQPFLRTDQGQRPVVGAHPFQSADEHSEAGGIQELNAFQVQDEVVGPVVDER